MAATEIKFLSCKDPEGCKLARLAARKMLEESEEVIEHLTIRCLPIPNNRIVFWGNLISGEQTADLSRTFPGKCQKSAVQS